MAESNNILIKAGGVAGAITAILVLYFTIQSGVKDIVTESSEALTFEIKETARDLADIHRSDLHVRIRTLDRQVDEINELPRPLPSDKALLLQRLKSQRDDLQHQVNEVNEKWFQE